MARSWDMERRWGDVAPVPSRRSFLRNLTHIIYRGNAAMPCPMPALARTPRGPGDPQGQLARRWHSSVTVLMAAGTDFPGSVSYAPSITHIPRALLKTRTKARHACQWFKYDFNLVLDI